MGPSAGLAVPTGHALDYPRCPPEAAVLDGPQRGGRKVTVPQRNIRACSPRPGGFASLGVRPPSPECSSRRERFGVANTVIFGLPVWLYESLARFMEKRRFGSVAEFVLYAMSREPCNASTPHCGATYSDTESALIRELLNTANQVS